MKNKQQAEKEVLDIIAYGNVKHSISIDDEKKAEKEVLDIITYGNIKHPVSIENEQQSEKEILNILARGNETEIKHFTSTEEKQQAEKEVLDIIARGNIKRPISVEDKQKAEKEVLDIIARGNETEIKHLLTDEVRNKFDYLIKDNLPKESIDIQEAIQKEIDDNVVTAKEQEIIKHYSAMVREDVSHRRDSQRRYERDFAQHLTVTQVKSIIKNQEFGIKKAFLNELKDFDKEAKNEIMSEMKSYTKSILNANTEEEKEKIAEDTYKKLHDTIEKHPTQKMKDSIKKNTDALMGVGTNEAEAKQISSNLETAVKSQEAIVRIAIGLQTNQNQNQDQNPNVYLLNKSFENVNKVVGQLTMEQFEALKNPEQRRQLIMGVVLQLMRDPDSIKEWADKKMISSYIAKHPDEFNELMNGNSKESQNLRALVSQNARNFHTEGKDVKTFLNDFKQKVQNSANESNHINPEEKNREEESKQDMLPKGSGGDNLAKMDEKALHRIEGENESLDRTAKEINGKSMIAM